MGTFYLCVADVHGRPGQGSDAFQDGKLTPYTAMVFFTLGIFASNFLFNTFIMREAGERRARVRMASTCKGTSQDHLWGIIGGMIWAVGMTLNIIASGKAGPAISYGLGQGATLIAAIWGVFIWREFRTAPQGHQSLLLALMFACFALGLGLLIAAKPS